MPRSTGQSAKRGRFWSAMRDLEVQLISAALRTYDGNVTAAAEDLGLHRTTLHRKIALLRLTRLVRGKGRPRRE